jgi:hypothetical protein
MMTRNQISSFPVIPNLRFMGGGTFQKGVGLFLRSLSYPLTQLAEANQTLTGIHSIRNPVRKNRNQRRLLQCLERKNDRWAETDHRGTAIALFIFMAKRNLICACGSQTERKLKVPMMKYYRVAEAAHGEHRIAFERRRFSYTGFIPERRSGKDRREAVSMVRSAGSFPVRSINEKWLSGR